VISLLPFLLTVCVALGQAPLVQVGSGEVRANLVAQTRMEVAQGLAELKWVFPGLAVAPFSVFLHESGDTLPNTLASARHQGAPGFALLGQHEIHLVIGDMLRAGASLASVVRHELVHELLDQYVAPGGGQLPRWFHEGLAQHLAQDTYLGAREQDLVWRVGTRRLLHFSDLVEGFPHGKEELRAAYAQSYSYVSWLVRRFGLAAVVRVAADTTAERSFATALVMQTGQSTVVLHDAWADYLVHGSGAWWRVLLEQCFDALLILALPALVVAWWRRRASGRLIAKRMARRQAMFPQEFELEQPEQLEQPSAGQADEDMPGRDRGRGG